CDKEYHIGYKKDRFTLLLIQALAAIKSRVIIEFLFMIIAYIVGIQKGKLLSLPFCWSVN
ncbi:MAG: hypothetical protein Q4E09_06530, partial [Eubacteriales bacterium]|nr:hypothetical protein [Eubacteriales bacterium]